MTTVRRLAAALAIAAIAAPAAQARPTYTHDTPGKTVVPLGQDLRSPDARDAAAAQSSRWQAYDEAVRHLTPAQQAVAFVPAKAAPPASAPSGDDHIDPRIVVGGVLAALLLGLRGLVLVARRRNASAPAVSS